jgi:hypothetical protein
MGQQHQYSKRVSTVFHSPQHKLHEEVFLQPKILFHEYMECGVNDFCVPLLVQRYWLHIPTAITPAFHDLSLLLGTEEIFLTISCLFSWNNYEFHS